jgi:hypothetical protein
MRKLTKAIPIAKANPACWKAHGSETTAVPIIVFQQLKMITRDDCFVPGAVQNVEKKIGAYGWSKMAG